MNDLTSDMRLSGNGKLAAFIGLALCTSPAWTANINPTSGANAFLQGNVDVINIAAPNAQGLSYNQYDSYNVGTAGAVLNNSLADGNSTLAGALTKNPQFNDRAASVILNEVVGNNPSLLLGQQEVFGMAADYVLANPQGITCNGCGFVNTPRASLVVGNANVIGGELQGFAVGQNNPNATLKISGDVSGAKNIDLIAPKFDINGNITSNDSINIIGGINQVNYNDLSVTTGAARNTVLDGSVVGSMSSGRIRIHNSSPNARTTVNADLRARDSIDINTQGTLFATGSNFAADDVFLNANNLKVVGKLSAQEDNGSDAKDKGDLVTNTKTHKNRSENFKRSSITAKKIQLQAANAVELNAIDIQANQVHVDANDVNLSSSLVTKSSITSDKDSKFAWFNEKVSDTQQQIVQGNHWVVSEDVSITARNGRVAASAAKIQAKSVAIDGNKGVTINGRVASNFAVNSNNIQNETAKLKTGKTKDNKRDESFSASAINATEVVINSKGTVKMVAVEVQGTNKVVINAKRKNIIAPKSTESSQSQEESYVYWGGIGGGKDESSSKSDKKQHTSKVSGKDVAVNGDESVNIQATKVDGKKSLEVSSSGKVKIDHANSESSNANAKRDGTAFNITEKSDSQQQTTQKTHAASLNSQGNVSVKGKDVELVGAQIAGKNVAVDAKASVTSNIATAANVNEKKEYKLKAHAYAESNGKILDGGKVGVRLEGITDSKITTNSAVTATNLTANNVDIRSDDSINLKGAQLNATAGKVNVSGKNVALAAGDVQQSSEKTIHKVDGGGIYISANTDGVTLGVEANTKQKHDSVINNKAVVTSIKATEGVNLHADNTLTNSATKITTSKDVNLDANRIVNNTAADVTKKHVVNGEGGVNLEVYAQKTPTVGATLTLGGKGDGKKTTIENAVVSDIAGENINVNGRNITDVGTKYTANQNLNIKAIKRYDASAAQNSETSVANVANAQASVNAYTGNFQDVTVEVGAKTVYQNIQEKKTTAVLGNAAAENVNVTAKNIVTSANLEGDKVTLQGKNVVVKHEQNSDSKNQNGFKLAASVGVTYVPQAAGAGITPSVAIEGGSNHLKVENTQAVTATLKGNKIAIDAEKLARVEGASVDAKNDLSVAGKTVNVVAVKDEHRATGGDWNANASLKLSMNGECLTDGGVGAGADFSVTDELDISSHGAKLQGKNVSLNSNDKNQALTIKGADIKGDSILIENKGGAIDISSAKNTKYSANVGMGLNANLKFDYEKAELEGMSANLDIEAKNNYSFNKGNIVAKDLVSNSGGDLNLQSDVVADNWKGNVGGNVAIDAAQDKTGEFELNTGFHFSGTPVKFSEETTFEDVVSVVKDDIEGGTFLGMDAGAKLNLQVNNSKVTAPSDIKVGNMDVKVGGGKVAVNASNLQSGGGAGFNGAQISATSNKDFTHDLGFNIDLETPKWKEMATNIANGEKVESPIQAGGHLNWISAHDVNSQIKFQ